MNDLLGVPKPGLIHARFVYIIVRCNARTCHCRCLFCSCRIVGFVLCSAWLARVIFPVVLFLKAYVYVLRPVFPWAAHISMCCSQPGWYARCSSGRHQLLCEDSRSALRSVFRWLTMRHVSNDFLSRAVRMIGLMFHWAKYIALCVSGFFTPPCVARGSNPTVGVTLNTVRGCHLQCWSGQIEIMSIACGSRVVFLYIYVFI